MALELITDVSQHIQPAETPHFPTPCSLRLSVAEAGNKNNAGGEGGGEGSSEKKGAGIHSEILQEVCGWWRPGIPVAVQ